MTRKLPWVAMVIILSVAINAPIARAQTDWTTVGFDVQRTGYNLQEATLSAQNVSNLQLNWNANLGGQMSTEPTFLSGVSVPQPDGSVVQTDLVYVGTQLGVFYALDAASGSIIWAAQLPTTVLTLEGCPDVVGIIAAPTIDRANGRIFVVAATTRCMRSTRRPATSWRDIRCSWWDQRMRRRTPSSGATPPTILSTTRSTLGRRACARAPIILSL